MRFPKDLGSDLITGKITPQDNAWVSTSDFLEWQQDPLLFPKDGESVYRIHVPGDIRAGDFTRWVSPKFTDYLCPPSSMRNKGGRFPGFDLITHPAE